jgi:hypothetical protein
MNIIDHFDSKIQPEELPFNELSESDVDAMAEEMALSPFEKGEKCGYEGGKEGDMPVDISDSQAWFDGFVAGAKELEFEGDCEEAEYKWERNFGLYGD